MSQRKLKPRGPIPIQKKSLNIELMSEEQKLFGLLHSGLACSSSIDLERFLPQVIRQTMAAVSQRHGMPDGSFTSMLTPDLKTLEIQEKP